MLVKMRGEEIRALREDRALNRREFAGKAGVAQGTLARVEGRRPVRLKTARKVAGELDREVGSLARPHPKAKAEEGR